MAHSATVRGRRRVSTPRTQTYNPNEPLFGKHWTLDAYGADPTALNNMETVFRALDQLPERLGMKKIITPYVIRFDGNDKKDAGGYSGFVMIAESHIAIHTFPDKKFVTIDVYTCQGDLDTRQCAQFFRSVFKYSKAEEQTIDRGRKYGHIT